MYHFHQRRLAIATHPHEVTKREQPSFPVSKAPPPLATQPTTEMVRSPYRSLRVLLLPRPQFPQVELDSQTSSSTLIDAPHNAHIQI